MSHWSAQQKTHTMVNDHHRSSDERGLYQCLNCIQMDSITNNIITITTVDIIMITTITTITTVITIITIIIIIIIIMLHSRCFFKHTWNCKPCKTQIQWLTTSLPIYKLQKHKHKLSIQTIPLLIAKSFTNKNIRKCIYFPRVFVFFFRTSNINSSRLRTENITP